MGPTPAEGDVIKLKKRKQIYYSRKSAENGKAIKRAGNYIRDTKEHRTIKHYKTNVYAL